MMMQPSPSIEFLQHPNIYIERGISIGKRLVIIAESDKGALYDPVLIYNKDMALELFGGGKLIQCYEDALTYQDDISIFLMRIDPFGYETAFSVLEAYDFDLLFISEMHFDKQTDLIMNFIRFAQIKEETGSMVHGITTLSPGMDYSQIASLKSSVESLSIEDGDDTIELGKYLSLVVNQMEFKDTGAVYAGSLASMDVQTSPVNKTIPDVTLSFEFTKEEILTLRSIGIVCFKNTFKKGVTCTSSSCAVSTVGSVHKHISNFRIAQALINQVSIELKPFIGMPNADIQAERCEQIVDAICYEHIALDRIKDFNYDVKSNFLNGYIEIEIEIVPIFSVHGMTTNSRVRVYK
jgi:hypothetical protein